MPFQATIVIPVLNQRSRWLKQCVLSALRQTVQCETFVVTAPATSTSILSQLSRLAREHPRLVVLPEEGPGFAAALNTGIRAASTPRVGFLLSDDWLHEEAAERCLPLDTTIVSTGFKVFLGDGTTEVESLSRSPSMEEFNQLPTLERKASYLKHFLLFQRGSLLEVGGVDETIGLTGPDDFDLPWTLLEQEASVSVIPDQLYNYRDHTGERLTLRSAEAQVQDLSKILDKHGVHGEERQAVIRHHSVSYGRTSRGTAELRKASGESGLSMNLEDGFPSVSIIVPARNAASTIRPCLESLLALEYPAEKIELIVVDNASADGTAEVLTEYGARAKVLREDKRGAPAARNRGLTAATGEVVAFTDADCEVDPQWLRSLVRPLSDKGIGIVGGRILSKRPCNWVELFGERIHDHERALRDSDPPYAITMNWASRSAVLREVGYFDEEYTRGEDVELSRRIAAAGFSLRYEAEAIIYHENEGTLAGLFGEGFKHGFWAVRIFRDHPDAYLTSGQPRFDVKTFQRIISASWDALRGRDPKQSLCFSTFNAGKKVGKLIGSIRWGFFHL
ncbi:MAG: glycosyltransferase family 2 protein [Gemmatimonadetes bacterium]|nr:glycosyltransferase family 2 protein [Gemmatimonadota bacterium]